MLSPSLKSHIGQILNGTIQKVEAVSGGDISKAYCLYTPTQRFLCKINNDPSALKMFDTEKEGLKEINLSKAIAVPQVLGSGEFEGSSFLLMEFIETKKPNLKDMETFGHQLAQMHSFSVGDSFGWKQDNLIGSLPQSNVHHPEWTSFYVYERLIPQLQMAAHKKLLPIQQIPKENTLLKGCRRFFPEVKPALLHGDLWSGNYLIGTQGTPYLIDPAVYYGHAEVDMAMTRLFGGFTASFYDAYAEHFPLVEGVRERTDLYQLYYLLVHLNLFGKSYYPSVIGLLERYFISS